MKRDLKELIHELIIYYIWWLITLVYGIKREMIFIQKASY